MFSLLTGIDPYRGGSLGSDRVLEHTEAELRTAYTPAGKLDLAILKLPAILMPEIDSKLSPSSPEQLAYFGRIVECKPERAGVALKVAPDPLLPPIPIQPTLWDLREELGIADFEFRRTHWALKAPDLFETLYRHFLRDTRKPRVFGIDRLLRVDPDQVSVMIRFRADFDQVFEAVKRAAEPAGFKCHRVRDIWERDAIITDIANLIMQSRVVVADLTDRNANVLYECGLAHGVGREVVPITQDGADNFDVQHLRHVLYQNTEAGRAELTQRLLARFKSIRSQGDSH